MAINGIKSLYRTANKDSIAMEKIDIADSLFIRFVDAQLRERERSLDMNAKCRNFIGEKELSKNCAALAMQRNALPRNYLQSNKGISASRIRFNAVKSNETDAYAIGKFMINFYPDKAIRFSERGIYELSLSCKKDAI